MIRLQDVSKTYGSERVVDGLSFEIPAGRTLCLIGSSGSGKSTTLRMLNRLIAPSSGRIWIDGQPIDGLDPVQLRRGIGYVIQQIGLFPHLTIGANLALPLELAKWPRARRRERVTELLELVQLEPALAGRYPTQLSGGQQQRVGVARALALQPRLILLDEPFAALDPLTRTELQDRFLELQRRLAITAVLVTHDLAEAFKCGDTIALLEKGRLQQIGSPAELLHHPNTDFIARFVRGAGAQLLELPVGKLAIPLAEAGPGWRSDGLYWHGAQVSGQPALALGPPLDPETPLRVALVRLLGQSAPGLPVAGAEPRVLLSAELRSLLA